MSDADFSPPNRSAVPPGAAIVERVGWGKDGRFTATLVFPTGAPDLPTAIVWKEVPMRLVRWDVAEAEPHG